MSDTLDFGELDCFSSNMEEFSMVSKEALSFDGMLESYLCVFFFHSFFLLFVYVNCFVCVLSLTRPLLNF
jgi:hypothetical protein